MKMKVMKSSASRFGSLCMICSSSALGFILFLIAAPIIIIRTEANPYPNTFSTYSPLTADITWYSTGASHSKEAFFLTKQVLSTTALKIYSRLPSNKTGLNVTFLVNSITPSAHNSYCNTSKIRDACEDILEATLIVTKQFKVVPSWWTHVVAALTLSDSAHIRHFYLYGCIGNISISQSGIGIMSISSESCPAVEKVHHESLLKESKTMSYSSKQLGNVWNCFDNTLSAGSCVLENPTIYIAGGLVMTGILGGFAYRRYTQLKAREENAYREIERALEQKMAAAKGRIRDITSEISEADAELNNLYEDLEGDITDCPAYRRGFMQGELDGRASMDQMQELIDALDDKLFKFPKQLSEMSTRGSLLKNFNQELSDRVEDLTKISEDVSKYGAEEVGEDMGKIAETDEVGCFDDAIWIESMQSPIEEVQLGALKCESDMESMSGEGVVRDSMAGDPKLVTNQEVVDNFVDKIPELGDLKGKAATMETDDVISKSMGEMVGSQMLIGIGMEALGSFLNTFLMFMVVQDMIEEAVKAIIHVLQKGFQAVGKALSNLAEQEVEQYKSTIQNMEKKIEEMVANLECADAWIDFREKLYMIYEDYKTMSGNLHQCKTVNNFTKSDYFNCEWQKVHYLQTRNWPVYQELGNTNKDAWEKSLAGKFVIECSKSTVISGTEPVEAAHRMAYFHDLAVSAISRAGTLYRWTASILMGHSFYYGSGFLNFTSQVNTGYFITTNQSRSFTAWFTEYVIPPAIAGYVRPTFWTFQNRTPPAMRYMNMKLIDMSTLNSSGYIQPLVWLPGVKTGENMYKAKPQSSGGPIHAFYSVTARNVTNATESAYGVCQSLLCFERTCECHAWTTKECVPEPFNSNKYHVNSP